MKKIILLFGIFTAFTFTVNAQKTKLNKSTQSIAPVIVNGSTLPAAGTPKKVYNTISTNGAGGAGADQVWDFSTSAFTQVGTFTIVTPSATPVASTYTSANFGFTISNSIYFLYNVSATKMESLCTDATSGGGGSNYTPNPKTMLQFPFNYGDVVNDTWQKVGGSQENLTITYDGYGILKTPYGNFADVVRIKESYTSGDDYTWYTVNPLLMLMHYSASGNGLILMTDNTSSLTENTNPVTLGVYPNPAKNNLTIALENIKNFDNTFVSIFNIEGQLVYQQTIKDKNTVVNIENFVNGMYIVKLFDKNNVSVSKFIKQ